MPSFLEFSPFLPFCFKYTNGHNASKHFRLAKRENIVVFNVHDKFDLEIEKQINTSKRKLF
jgi:hypothetical protein